MKRSRKRAVTRRRAKLIRSHATELLRSSSYMDKGRSRLL